MEIIEKLWKEYQKNTQKVKVISIGLSLLQKQSKKVRIAKKKGQEATKQASASTNEASKNLQQTVQGQFGKKVNEAFKRQKNTLKNL
ncbi:MAG: hypothetical protein IC227_05775 [Enterococcus lacertideformus]|uniref:Uncharacterized protein n=1 Tax=Enterococcus lacertideformus TaxID=2771493 RepID=A0A931AY81_9ENTE|nr:hypothetical protein [Enterococcus lacertideformus]